MITGPATSLLLNKNFAKNYTMHMRDIVAHDFHYVRVGCLILTELAPCIFKHFSNVAGCKVMFYQLGYAMLNQYYNSRNLSVGLFCLNSVKFWNSCILILHIAWTFETIADIIVKYRNKYCVSGNKCANFRRWFSTIHPCREYPSLCAFDRRDPHSVSELLVDAKTFSS